MFAWKADRAKGPLNHRSQAVAHHLSARVHSTQDRIEVGCLITNCSIPIFVLFHNAASKLESDELVQ
jgi:hypothetical protein